MSTPIDSIVIGRRQFLRDVGASALLLAISETGCHRLAESNGPFEPLAYVRVDANGDVVITAHRSEFGQGTKTSLAMALADELEADWSRVRIEQAPGDEKRYGNQDTDGSSSVRLFLLPMRRAGATGRAMLEAAAARRWDVPLREVTARLHQVVHTPSGRTLPYAALVGTARTLAVPPADRLTLKQPSQFRYIGIGVPMVDLTDMTCGRARYGIDQRLDGMRYAVIARPPVYGGTLARVDATAAERVPGVERIVRLGHPTLPSGMSPLGGVAVVATNTWAAMRGRQALVLEWSDGRKGDYDSVAYRDQMTQASRRTGTVIRRQGDASATLARAARRLVAEYYVPHLAHASLEPPNAVARVAEGQCEIWAPTQDPQGARDAVAKALGLSTDAVRVNVTLIGGAFGRKSFHDFIIEAALVSRAAGVPVQLLWTREDDVQHDFYLPPAFQHLEAAVTERGEVAAWLHRSTIPSLDSMTNPKATHLADWEVTMGLIDFPYAVPNVQVEVGDAEARTRLGWYRSVLSIPHTFAVSSFLDEIAHATHRDPPAFLVELLGPDRTIDMRRVGIPATFTGFGGFDEYPFDTGRLRRVLQLVADRAGWGRALPRGEGLGIAAVHASRSYLASVVHVAVAADGAIAIPRIDIGIDCGFVLHPDRVRAQMEGGTIMGLGNALGGEVTFVRGRPQQANFDGYRVLRMDAAPREIRVHLVPSDAKPGGVGEPGVAPTAPALCNAIFAATGRRVRTLPLGRQMAEAVS